CFLVSTTEKKDRTKILHRHNLNGIQREVSGQSSHSVSICALQPGHQGQHTNKTELPSPVITDHLFSPACQEMVFKEKADRTKHQKTQRILLCNKHSLEREIEIRGKFTEQKLHI
ncbi:hypothetical protein H1C71_019812, partial [Ictidomys tridecemlineatus]